MLDVGYWMLNVECGFLLFYDLLKCMSFMKIRKTEGDYITLLLSNNDS